MKGVNMKQGFILVLIFFSVMSTAVLSQNVTAGQDEKKPETGVNPKDTSPENSTTVKEENTADEGKIRLTTRRKIRKSRIQELQNLQKKRKGTDIFGLGLAGFTGGLSLGNLKGSTKAGTPSDSFNGLGMGAMFSIEFAGGQMNSIGFKTSGQWYWRWGSRMQLDFVRRTDSDTTINKRVVNELLGSGIIYHYFPMEEFSFSKNIIILNRFHYFVGFGPMWSLAIEDTIENSTTKTFSKGPTQADFFVALSAGWNMQITTGTYWTFDYRLGFNMTSEIEDDLTGKVIGGGNGGMIHTFHTGLAYPF